MGKELKPIDISIAEEYIKTGNGVQSVLAICPDKKYEAAERYFERLLGNVGFTSLIDDAKKTAAEKLGVTVEFILEKLLSWLESDVTETMDLTVDEIKDLPKEVRTLITGFKVAKTEFSGKGGSSGTKDTIELKFVDKTRAMDMITKHIGFFKEDNDQKKIDFNNVKIGFK